MTSQRKRRQKKRRFRGQLNDALFIEAGTLANGRLQKIPSARLNTLRVDHSYQREEKTRKVNELAAVLEQNGDIFDPIVVAQRPDKSLYIVDGQQRWLAHQRLERDMLVRIVPVDDIVVEKKLFQIMNSRATILGTVIAKGWQNSAGELLHWLNESEDSPLRGSVGFENYNSGRIAATTLTKCLVIAMTGQQAKWQTTRVLSALDVQIEQHGMDHAKKVGVMLGVIFGKVFSGRVKAYPPQFLAMVCCERWAGRDVDDPWSMPDPKQVQRLRRLDWGEYEISQGSPWRKFPLAEIEINRAWKPEAAKVTA